MVAGLMPSLRPSPKLMMSKGMLGASNNIPMTKNMNPVFLFDSTTAGSAGSAELTWKSLRA